MIRLKFSFGPYEVMVEGQREHDIFRQASLWGEIAALCVGRKQVVLKHRVSQNFDFYEVVDAQTGERLQFGQRKEDNGLFPKGWQPPYQQNQQAVAAYHPPQNVPRNPPAPAQYRQQAPPPPQGQGYRQPAQMAQQAPRQPAQQAYRPPPPQPQQEPQYAPEPPMPQDPEAEPF